MTGKEKCELLKAIRKNIAEMNGIEYYPEQCEHEGNCPGFCPRCDMEASYLMKELKKKEAAGSPIRIDTESLAQFETLSSEPVDEDDNDCIVGDIRTPGIIAPPEDLDGDIMPLQGDVVMPDDLDDDSDSEPDEENDDSEEGTIDGEQLLEDNRKEIDRMCRGCSRFDTIMATDKGVRCACLSEHFFIGMLEKMSCSLKR